MVVAVYVIQPTVIV